MVLVRKEVVKTLVRRRHERDDLKCRAELICVVDDGIQGDDEWVGLEWQSLHLAFATLCRSLPLEPPEGRTTIVQSQFSDNFAA